MKRTISQVSKSIKLIVATLALVAIYGCEECPAQDSIPASIVKPATTVANYLAANTNATAATNWTFAPYVSRAGNKWGGGLAAVYYVNAYVGTQIRMQYLDIGTSSRVWLPNGTITLQSTYRPFGEGIPLTLRPLVELGAATDLRGNLMAIAGAGAEVDLFSAKTSDAIVQRISLFAGYEKWQGKNTDLKVQQFGLAINMNLEKVLKKVFGK